MENRVDVDNLTFNTVCNYLSTEENRNLQLLININSGMWLVDTLLYYVSDQNPGVSMANTDRLKEIVNLAYRIYKSTWNDMFDIINEEIDVEKYLKYTKQSRYCIEAAGGIRVATVNEVEEGLVKVCGDEIIEIVDSPVVKLTQSEEIFINLFVWAVTGKWRYYIKAGYSVKYDSSGKLDEPEIRYILNIANVLGRMCELFDTGTYYSNLILKIKGIKKLGVYKYPEYAIDEIKPDETIAFVINQVEKLMPRYKSGILKKCSSILYGIRKRGIKVLTTEDKITLRKGYIEIKYPSKLSKGNSDLDVNDKEIKDTKELCDRIRKGVADGFLDSNEFVVKVVGTLSKNNYRYCSIKQRRVIVEAINKIEANKGKDETAKAISEAVQVGDTGKPDEKAAIGLEGLSDLLGRGMLEDE